MQAILDLDTQVHARLKHYGEMQNCDVKCFCSKNCIIPLSFDTLYHNKSRIETSSSYSQNFP